MHFPLRLYVCLLCATLAPSAFSQPQVELEHTFTNLSFSRPVDLQYHGDHLFIVEQLGSIWRFTNDTSVQEKFEFLNITDRVHSVGNEEGLLGLAFHPDFDSNGHFFVYYTASSPRRTVVSRFTIDLNSNTSVDPDSETIVLEINQPASNHNGGQLAFGADGYLYIALGDGGGAGDTYNHGQNTQSLLGTISRIDVTQLPYTIPRDNPFAGSSGGSPEIFAWGLRNPWRFSFDSKTGVIYTADVGQNAMEEVNIVEKGQNYGWPIMEGTQCYRPSTNCNKDGLILPIFAYGHSAGPASVIGGYVYRGSGAPDLTGWYLLGDYVDGRFWGLLYDGEKLVKSHLLMDTFLSPLSFGIDQQGEVYMLAGNGKIYRFSPTGGSLGFESFISPLQFTQNIIIPETILPAARGGSGSYIYSISPMLPSGLSFDPVTRMLHGTPSDGLASTIFTLHAEDTNGLQGASQFQLSVVNPTRTEHSDEVLQGFALQGYYHSSDITHIVFDLPEPAIVSVDLYDLIGRRVTGTIPKAMNSAQKQSIPIATNTLPSGSYIYRVTLKLDSRIITTSKLLLIQ